MTVSVIFHRGSEKSVSLERDSTKADAKGLLYSGWRQMLWF